MLDVPGKHVRSPSNGLLTSSRTEASVRRREVRVKREAERGASQARDGAKCESCVRVRVHRYARE